MKRKEKKHSIAARLAASASLFYPELKDIFICPTCLSHIPLSEGKSISKAHVIPESAGGKLTTLLCTKCNNDFGKAQDKWSGEFLRMAHGRKTLLHTKQKGYFHIGETRVGGEFKIKPDGGLDFLIDIGRTAPAALEQVKRQATTGQMTVTIPLPLLENRQFIDFGLLTSAYLLWFKELGYSFALQAHLDPIREMILHPAESAIPKSMGVVASNQFFDLPWIGIGEVASETCLLAGIANRIFFLPPVDRPDLYDHLPKDFTGVTLADGAYRVLRFYEHHNFDGPLGVAYHDRMVVFPDVLFTRPEEARILLYPLGVPEPQLLYPTPEDEFERLKQSPTARGVEMSTRLIAPGKETGRSHGDA